MVALADDPDMEHGIIDSTIVRAHAYLFGIDAKINRIILTPSTTNQINDPYALD